MLNFSGINLDDLVFDVDGDGTPDTFADGFDLDGDGTSDFAAIDVDRDGTYDVFITNEDTNGDGFADTLVEYDDLDNDGIIDDISTFSYSDNGEYYDTAYQDDVQNDDTYNNSYGEEDDGSTFQPENGMFVDTDIDGTPDIYLNFVDTDGNNVQDLVEIYDIDDETGEFNFWGTEILPDDIPAQPLFAEDLENFDPANADIDDVTGNPEESMEEWEFQGDTNRCALYSQKFIIDEFTGQDVDIEEIADIAEENGWFSEEGGTPIMDMNKVLEYYDIDNEMSFDNDIDDLRDCLESGGKAIVSIDADEIWYGETDDLFLPEDGVNHAVQVIGIDESNPNEPMVILNDSGNPNGCGSMIPLDNFMDAWEDGNFQMIECYA